MNRGVWLLLALPLVLSGAIFLQYQSDLSSTRKHLLSDSRIAHTACGSIEYAAKGSGPAVLVVHGAGGGYSQVAEISGWLVDADFRVIAMSRFGYLRTPLPTDASPRAQADAHACLLDALDVTKAAVIGLSAGAPSAIEYALRHPERCSALVLLVPAIAVPGRTVEETTPPSPFWQFVYKFVLRSDFAIWAITRLQPEMLVETVLGTPRDVFQNASPAERRRALGVVRDIFPVTPRADGLVNDASVTTLAPTGHLEQITAPTLAISTTDDLYRTDGGARFAAEQILGARLLVFSNGGHAWLDHNAEVRGAITTFLRTEADQQ